MLTEDENVGAVLEVESPPPRLVHLGGLGRLLLALGRRVDLDDTVLAIPTAPADGLRIERVLALAGDPSGVPGREEAGELRVDDLDVDVDDRLRVRGLKSQK